MSIVGVDRGKPATRAHCRRGAEFLAESGSVANAEADALLRVGRQLVVKISGQKRFLVEVHGDSNGVKAKNGRVRPRAFRGIPRTGRFREGSWGVLSRGRLLRGGPGFPRRPAQPIAATHNGARLQATSDGANRDVQKRRDFLVPQSIELLEHDNRPVIGREGIQRLFAPPARRSTRSNGADGSVSRPSAVVSTELSSVLKSFRDNGLRRRRSVSGGSWRSGRSRYKTSFPLKVPELLIGSQERFLE